MTRSPRIVIAGLSGDSGKTLVSLALALAARERGHEVVAFKKGPDYIDAAWLAWAAGRPARNLDTYLMGCDGVAASFERHATPGGVNLIEGNRGLYDGVDADGTHSTAALARLLDAPVLLVVSAAKATRTVAAQVLGCQTLDPGVRFAGVILNRIGGPRHESVVREAIETLCGIPVVGAIPRLGPCVLVPGRHMGLVTPAEHQALDALKGRLLNEVASRIDVDGVLAIASGESESGKRDACPTAVGPASRRSSVESASHRSTDACVSSPDGSALRIGYITDSAFTFYYPENLEALDATGAALIAIPAVTGGVLPDDLDALYIGGGFPETHAVALSANTPLLRWLRDRAEAGLPIYAECGGLMLLSRAIIWRGDRFPMAGVLPFDTEVCDTPQGHGYVELMVDQPNPFYPEGLAIRGHTFHYSRPLIAGDRPPTACSVTRGTGSWSSRDGIIRGNIWASYAHVHALGTPAWTEGVIRAARRFSERGVTPELA